MHFVERLRRQDKKVSNAAWESPTDPDSRLARMKDGTTHLASKAEHVVDLESGVLLAAEITPADHGDPQAFEDSLPAAQANLNEAAAAARIRNVVADRGYHGGEALATIAEHAPYRTVVAERPRRGRSSWRGKRPALRTAVLGNRRRVRSASGKAWLCKRGESVERSFAHVCETGGGRRSWLRGIDQVRMRYLIQGAAFNLGIVLRHLFGIGTPRSLQGLAGVVSALFMLFQLAYLLLRRAIRRLDGIARGGNVSECPRAVALAM